MDIDSIEPELKKKKYKGLKKGFGRMRRNVIILK
jgi:hypothetical protein